jgi:hypothetical protein
LYGKKPLGVLGGDQIPVRSGVELVDCGRAARASGAIRGSSPSDKTSTAEAVRIQGHANRFIRKILSLKLRVMPRKFMIRRTLLHSSPAQSAPNNLRKKRPPRFVIPNEARNLSFFCLA